MVFLDKSALWSACVVAGWVARYPLAGFGLCLITLASHFEVLAEVPGNHRQIHGAIRDPGEASLLFGSHQVSLSDDIIVNDQTDDAFGEIKLTEGMVVGTGFEEPPRLARSYVRGANGPGEIGWSLVKSLTTSGTIDVRNPTVVGDHPAAGGVGSGPPHSAPTNKFLRIANGRFEEPFTTEKIDVSQLTAEQKSRFVAKIDVRSFTNNGTTFETVDTVLVTIQGSEDGVQFRDLFHLLEASGDTPPADELIRFRSDEGNYTILSTEGQFQVSAEINSLRLAISGGIGSDGEFVYFDNIRCFLRAFGDIDHDADGMASGWEMAHNLDPEEPNDAGLDDDGDGFTNAAEFAADTDPHRAADFLKLGFRIVGPGTVEFAFQLRPHREYRIEASMALGSDSWIPQWYLGPENEQRAVTFLAGMPGAARYFRLVASPAPPEP